MTLNPIHYFKQQIDEIRDSSILPFYGIALSIAHILSYFFWNYWTFLQSLAEGTKDRIPWPQMLWTVPFSISSVCIEIVFKILLIASVGGVFAFGLRKIKIAYVLLVLSFFAKVFLFSLDRRYMGNYHFMLFWVSFCYLFISRKTTTIQYLIVGFYLASGVIKVRGEWLSGAVISSHSMHPSIRFLFENPILLRVGVHWVVFLELLISLFLVMENPALRWFALLQYLGFHLLSAGIVGYFFPSIMFCLLLLFPLSWWKKESISWSKLNLAGRIVLAAFFLCQLQPILVGKNPELSGEGNWYALNMFDAKAECVPFTLVKDQNRTLDLTYDNWDLATRIRCDPYIFYYSAQSMCNDFPGAQISLNLLSRARTGKRFVTILNESNLCALPGNYSTIFPNSWVKPNE